MHRAHLFLLLSLAACDPGELAGESPEERSSQASCSAAVTGFTLIDADRDQPVAGHDPLRAGATLDLSSLPRALNIRANLAGGAVQKVRFDLDGATGFRTESLAPYALGGDQPAGDYQPLALAAGAHSVSATPYVGGVACVTATISFTVVNAGTTAPPSSPAPPPSPPAASTAKLTVGIVQMRNEGVLAKNRDKVVSFIGQARAAGARLVVFPESALSYDAAHLASPSELAQAKAAVAAAAAQNKVYVLYGVEVGARTQGGKNEAYALDPTGKEILAYKKVNDHGGATPKPFSVDGVLVGPVICADRWFHSVTELPLLAGAQLSVEMSWSPDAGGSGTPAWGPWWVPRVLRNGVFLVRSGTSGIVEPDLKLHAGPAGTDSLLVRTLDLAKATRAPALARRGHPLLKPFWDAGLTLLAGGAVSAPAFTPLASPAIPIRVAAAQIALSRSLTDNVARMRAQMKAARAQGADLVVFPELAVTGSLEADIKAASGASIDAAVATLTAEAQQQNLVAIFGAPYRVGGSLRNSAFVVGPSGLITRHDQIAPDRPALFSAGTSLKTMAFSVNGVPAAVSVGSDRLWEELAELWAVRGVQILVNLSNDNGDAANRERVLWGMAGFRTLTVAVNAASPAGLAQPSGAANGGSAIWDDLSRAQGSYTATKLAGAGSGEALLVQTRTVSSQNPHGQAYPLRQAQMVPWYRKGIELLTK